MWHSYLEIFPQKGIGLRKFFVDFFLFNFPDKCVRSVYRVFVIHVEQVI